MGTLNLNSGTITGLNAGGLPDASVQAADLASGVGGKILQVVQDIKQGTSSHDTTTWTDIPGLSLSITPSSASNKILVLFSGSGSTANIGFVRLMRDSEILGQGNESGSRVRCTCMFHKSGDGNLLESFSFNYLDSPNSTSALTYKLQWRDESGTIYINRSQNDNDGSSGSRTASVITAMEVAA